MELVYRYRVKSLTGLLNLQARAVNIVWNFCNWYLNVVLSTGEKIENPRHYRRLEERLGKAQRAAKSRLATKIHAKIVNKRRDQLHKLSHRIVRQFDHIAVGNVSAA